MTVVKKECTYAKMNCLKIMKAFNCEPKKKMNSDLFKNVIFKTCLEFIYLIYI